MALVAWGAAALVPPGGALVQVLVGGAAGAATYGGLCLLLHVEALDFFVAAVRRRVRHSAARRTVAASI